MEPRPLREARQALGLAGAAQPVGGGDIHSAWRIEGGIFVKGSEGAPPGMFAIEAAGLEALRGAARGTVGVPEVLGFGERFLALRWIQRGRGGAAQLGRGLAAVHRSTARDFGWDRDGWIGTLVHPGGRQASLAEWFLERRLRPHARALGSSRLEGLVDSLGARLDGVLPDEAPALLHGDLWGGNWMADEGGGAWLFDPAVHHGCREQDLAMTRLFGGFPREFYDSYEAAWPLAPGWEERVDLWNLHPLLVHARLFGGGYGVRAEGILRRYAG